MATDGTPISDPALYRLMTWLSPGFPVGSYTYSHGIEYAVEVGLIGDRESLSQWIAEIVLRGSGLVTSHRPRKAHPTKGSPGARLQVDGDRAHRG